MMDWHVCGHSRLHVNFLNVAYNFIIFIFNEFNSWLHQDIVELTDWWRRNWAHATSRCDSCITMNVVLKEKVREMAYGATFFQLFVTRLSGLKRLLFASVKFNSDYTQNVVFNFEQNRKIVRWCRTFSRYIGTDLEKRWNNEANRK